MPLTKNIFVHKIKHKFHFLSLAELLDVRSVQAVQGWSAQDAARLCRVQHEGPPPPQDRAAGRGLHQVHI